MLFRNHSILLMVHLVKLFWFCIIANMTSALTLYLPVLVQAERGAMVTVSKQIATSFAMYINFQKNDDKRAVYSCLGGGRFSEGFSEGYKEKKNILNVIITKVDSLKYGNHIDRLKHSIFVN